MTKLPFLQNDKLPKLRKLSGVSKYGFSEDDELIESMLNELVQAIESKDHKQMREALGAIIDCIMNKESEGSDAPDSFEEASSI
jgi:hypothetical protein